MGLWIVVILWTLCLVAGGNAATSWRALCGSPPQDTGCVLVRTECDPLETNITGTSQNLSITSVFTSIQPDRDRWYPRLNVSFVSELGNADTQLTVRIAYRGKHALPRKRPIDKCFNLTIKGYTQHQKFPHQHQTISLLSGDVNPDHRPLFLHFRVRGVGTDFYTEGSISLPHNTKGLPACYRRIVPDVDRDKFCCTDWTSPLVVRNSSCHKTIVVEFEMAPKGCIQGYLVGLEYKGRKVRPPTLVNATEDVEFGRVTFTNISLSSDYYVSLKTLPTSLGNTDVVSGYVSVSNAMDCTMEQWNWETNLHPGGLKLHRLLLIVFSITISLLLILTVTFAVILKKTEDNRSFRRTDPCLPEEPRPQKKTVFLVYCMDNKHHRNVVRKFADLLQREGHCDVILDQWQPQRILEEGFHIWVGKRYERANKVIVIGSEGVYNFMDAKKRDCYWPALENAFPLSRVFPLAVKVLQDSISAHTKSKCFALTFSYTQEYPQSRKILKELTCNDIQYCFNENVERLMLSIHDTSKYVCGNNMMEWGTDLLKTETGQQLEMVIAEAEQFHGPGWFSKNYGMAIPYPQMEAKINNLNRLSDSLYYIKDQDEVELAKPEECNEEDEDLSKAVFLVPPADLPVTEDPDFIGPEDIESDSSTDIDIESSKSIPLIGTTNHPAFGYTDLRAPEDDETDSTPDSQLIEQYGRGQQDLTSPIFWKPQMHGVPVLGNTNNDSSSSSVDFFDSGIGMTERSMALGSVRVRSVPLTSKCLEDDGHGYGKVDDIDYGDGPGLIHPASSLSSPSSVSCSGSSSQSLTIDMPQCGDLLLTHLNNPRLPV